MNVDERRAGGMVALNVRRRALTRTVLLAAAALAVIAVPAGAWWARAELRASLPVLDGAVAIAGLRAPVSIDRDALGIPWIRGSFREDVAEATGFLHAQDRFFQMDLARRRAAGELAALVGARALPLDREIRIHRFRSEALRAVAMLSPRDRAVLDAYTNGVNAGLSALHAPPFEYLALRQTPVPWRPEDSLLVVLSMFITLQDPAGSYESTLATMHDVLPREMFEFIDPRGTGWDAPIVGPAFAMPPVPGPQVYDLRARRAGKPPIGIVPPPNQQSIDRGTPSLVASLLNVRAPEWLAEDAARESAVGSNSWVLSGALSNTGHPIVANDMHLSIRVPNTWYRAALEWPDAASGTARHLLAGVTLPGVPALVVGSNTHVAWGFTNTYADWSDVVLLEVDPRDGSRYRTPDGWRTFDRHDETITVAGGPDEHFTTTWTIWGPVIAPDYHGRPRAYRWVAHDAVRLARTLTPLEDARTVSDAFDAVNGLGTPGQNFVVADESGRIGWSIYGSIPRRSGLDGRLPQSWADGTRGWSGWFDPSEYPRVVDPASGRIWTANARVVDGEMLAKLGDGSYEVGSRATIIRDRLMARDRFTPADMLAIQLDASADFLARWQQLILRTLTPAAVAGHAERSTFRTIVDREWSGQALPDSVAYRLTRSFRERVAYRVMTSVLAECYDADPAFDFTTLRRREGPIWTLVTEQPMHLLAPQYSSWNDLLVASVDDVLDEARGLRAVDLHELVWSKFNVTAYRHPLSASVPFAGRWLDMPLESLPGDLFTVRVQWGAAGASERMIVSPGHENEAMMHMPTGQSGHPLSPFYSNSHEAWAAGRPTPFLPGTPIHSLRLVPSVPSVPSRQGTGTPFTIS